MYRIGVEHILGLQRRGNALLIDPCISPEWKGYSMIYRFDRIRVMNSRSRILKRCSAA